MTTTLQTDVAIIGAGPVGIFTIFQCGMLGLSCHVFDSLDQLGGQCTALYPEKPIYDIPAYPDIQAGQLISQLEKQAAPFNPTYHLGAPVVAVAKTGDRWTVKTGKALQVEARAVIIAAGGGVFGPQRPPLDNLEEFEGRSVFYAIRHREAFRGKNIVIAGGGDSAVDWAVSLADIASKIYIVHRRDKFRAAPASVEKLEALVETGRVERVIPFQLSAIHGQKGQLESVDVVDLEGNQKTLAADVLLPFFGLSMDLGPLAEWGLNLDRQTVKVTPETMETNESGIYAVGDICNYPGKLRLILTGFSESAQAAHAVYARLNPGKALHSEYSTTRGVPKAL